MPSNKWEEALDRILQEHGAEDGEFTYSLKLALTNAVKELVETAKPEIQANPIGSVTIRDCQRGLDTYQANLLKAIGDTDNE